MVLFRTGHFDNRVKERRISEKEVKELFAFGRLSRRDEETKLLEYKNIRAIIASNSFLVTIYRLKRRRADADSMSA